VDGDGDAAAVDAGAAAVSEELDDEDLERDSSEDAEPLREVCDGTLRRESLSDMARGVARGGTRRRG